MAKNDFIKRVEQAKAEARLSGRIFQNWIDCDMFQIALGRMGFGEKRIKDFRETFEKVFSEYMDELVADNDTDAWYFKSKVDRELAQYVGDSFEPWEQRHDTDKSLGRRD